MSNNELERNSENEFIYHYLLQQSEEMKKINDEINIQQHQFNESIDDKFLDAEESFSTQKVLRERIKAIEKAYIDLKCKFMTIQSSIS